MRTLQLLNWDIKDINKYLDEIRYQGFDSIQINPIQPLKYETKDYWWMSYQPIGFRIGNIYGSKEDLNNLCNNANNKDIKIIADVICNHMAGCDDGSIYPHPNVDKELTNNKYFWKSFDNVTDWNNRYEVTHKSMGLPGLDLSNYDLQNIIINFLNELIDCGVMGFRFDASKSIALPNEGCDFFPRVIYLLKKYGLYIYGEVLFDDKMISEYAKYIKVLTTSNYYDKNSIVKFEESHDSYYSLKWSRNWSSNEISNRYHNLCDNYPNTIYFARPYDDEWKSNTVRNANKIKKKYYH